MQRDRGKGGERAPVSMEDLGRRPVLQRSLRRLSPRAREAWEKMMPRHPKRKQSEGEGKRIIPANSQ